jgi:hypothetical protein
VDASSNWDLAWIRFGYAENGGNPAMFYRTPRQEDCSITIPAHPGRIVYYAIDRTNSATGSLDTSAMMIAVSPYVCGPRAKNRLKVPTKMTLSHAASQEKMDGPKTAARDTNSERKAKSKIS